MQFTRLRLNGFKSFVDPTDLVIGPGLTGVVGPNGCGKSNLLEALRWVMGENRPTAMRGGGMEDVIFAGAATRPAKSFAEVTLQIDNAARTAPAAFNDADQLEVVRRITRDAGSAYKAGGKEARARDVQMLFADAASGAASPALVRQGQIAELIAAKPQARRRVLEDAAGISGLHQRRHEAELKLNAAEANLARTDDQVAQLAGQLGQLARQAKQAARYREIGEKLRAGEDRLLYRRWHEAETRRGEEAEALRARGSTADHAVAAARQAAADRAAAAEALPPLREEDQVAAAVLQRREVERDTLAARAEDARGRVSRLEARTGQLARDLEREAALNADADAAVATLESEIADLDAAGEGHSARLDTAAAEAAEAERTLAEREAEQTRTAEEAARLSAQHQAARRARDDAAEALAFHESEVRQARESADAAATAEARAAAEQTQAETAATEARAVVERAEAALSAAEADRAGRDADATQARTAAAEADATANALRAEIAALAKLAEEEGAAHDQLLDAVEVEAGFEAALGAALADDLRLPEAADGASGWAPLPDYAAPPSLPDPARPLSDHVTAPAVLARRMAQIGLVAAESAAWLQADLVPGQRLVTTDGDLWRWDGLVRRAGETPRAETVRLERRNRLAALRGEFETAEAEASTTAEAARSAEARLSTAAEAERVARETRREADSAVTEAARSLSKTESERERAAGKRETLAAAAARHEAEAEAARARLSEAERTLADLPDVEASRTQAEESKKAAEAEREAMLAKRAAHEAVGRDGEARAARRAAAVEEIAGWRRRAETARGRTAELTERKERTAAELAEARGEPDAIAARHADLEAHMAEDEHRRRAAAGALAAGEAALAAAEKAERTAEHTASEAREARAAAEARAEAAESAAAAATARISDERETTPEALAATLGEDAGATAAEDIEAEIARLRRSRDALGAVNLRAEEDARQVQAEHDGLVAEKAELDEAIGQLRTGIASLNREGRERLLGAFEQVNANFAALFGHLFGGGQARLVLVESDDPLEAGLEIMCQPPGKKLAQLSLLSGGEQTLTALALIFAVFLANPAPICVLDEVDAPLDDANVTRFCDLLDEMTRRTHTRFLVITHHAVTMSRMSRLFGVTMAEQGVSQLVSVDLEKAEKMVA